MRYHSYYADCLGINLHSAPSIPFIATENAMKQKPPASQEQPAYQWSCLNAGDVAVWQRSRSGKKFAVVFPLKVYPAKKRKR